MTDYSEYFEDEDECLLVDGIVAALKDASFTVIEPPRKIVTNTSAVMIVIDITSRIAVLIYLESKRVILAHKEGWHGGDTKFTIIESWSLFKPTCFGELMVCLQDALAPMPK